MLGESAGRSAGNRMGEGARRRATPRERSLVDPPRDQTIKLEVPGVSDGYRLTRRGERVFTAAAWLSWIGWCVLLTIVLLRWFTG